jgi:hypothetical protein
LGGDGDVVEGERVVEDVRKPHALGKAKVEFAGYGQVVEGKEAVLIRIASARKVETSTRDAEGMTEKSASTTLKRKERVVEIRASTSSTGGSRWEEANLDLTELR